MRNELMLIMDKLPYLDQKLDLLTHLEISSDCVELVELAKNIRNEILEEDDNALNPLDGSNPSVI